MQRNHRCTGMLAVAVVFYALLVLSNNASADVGDSCESINSLPGTCMLPQQCPWVRENVERKRLYSMKTLPICGFTISQSLVCCPDERTTTRTQLRKAEQACRNFSRGSTYIAQHIVDGKLADIGEIPFIAALGYNLEDSQRDYDFRCGASWIAKNFLLTAAHCVTGADQPVVARIGTLNLTESDNTYFQDSAIKKVYRHPAYKPKMKYHDIALIELVDPFKYDDNVNKICLYTDSGDIETGQLLTASGWGLTATDGSGSEVLLKVDLKTEPLDRCKQDYENQVGTFHGKLASGVIDQQYCAIGTLGDSGNRGDTCFGDSGGPLHYRDVSADRFYQVGITSFGLGCSSESASIYTRVAAYLDWIEAIVWPDDAALLDN